MDKLKIDKPVIVEGKYDKIKLSGIIDAQIITTDGFGIFSQEEKKVLIRRLAEKNGIIILTDSDGGGLVIRNFFNSILPKDKVTHLYIPVVKGKERRKKSPSKEGTLGVEGIENERLRAIFAPFADKDFNVKAKDKKITKTHLYEDGLSGREDSAKLRKAVAKKAGLPGNMSANAFLEALNLLYTYEQYKELLNND